MDVLCLMFECEERGVLSTGGRPWTDQEIAAAVRGETQEVLSCLRELTDKGVAHWNSSGALFSKRLVRDEQVRKAATQRKANQRCHAEVTGDVTPKSQTQADQSHIHIESSVLGFSLDSKSKPPNKKKFDPPARSEVLNYMQEIGILDADQEVQKFFDHHAPRKWRISGGRGPLMTDWKAAVRTWKSNLLRFGGNHAAARATLEEQADKAFRDVS